MEGEGYFVNGGAGRNLTRNVEGDYGSPERALTGGAREYEFTGSVAPRPVDRFVQGVVLARR